MGKGAIIVWLLLLLAACGTPKQETPLDYAGQVGSTDLSGERVIGIELGDSEASVMDLRGKPNRTVQMDSFEVWEYGDANYTMSDGRVISYVISYAATRNGIKVGDTMQSVRDKYGDAYYNRTYDNISYMGYIDKEKRWVLEFVASGDVVTGIVIGELSLFEDD
ncbi:hypothetical protein [Paenibacillus arenilitoris]|uniref:DUF4309 domain-containing protein n=1 Tax=Paenibacillus arenilitoris TaxID=2772299 RepID=A0A927CME8_9BACL|nr:hypothetical protein [Paenibacillus arenilitoris]MBD2869922.1 hypothetical protein [Paenibacillus arenilitoris]